MRATQNPESLIPGSGETRRIVAPNMPAKNKGIPNQMANVAQGIERMTYKSLVAVLLFVALDARACWDQAAARYQVNEMLLYAIARTESGLNPLAVGRNRNGSHDIGVMQINSAWLPRLATYGVSEQDLLEPCTNIHIGAWILALNFQKLGYTWEAVGAYNAKSPALRRAYVERVRRNLLPTAIARGVANVPNVSPQAR